MKSRNPDRPKNVVSEVVANHLCCGCGACVAICPTDALEMRQTAAGFIVAAENGKGKCIECDKCLHICPGIHMNASTSDEVDDPFIGPVDTAYWGWAANAPTRRNGASGGVITAILQQLMISGSIEAALLTRWNPDNSLEHETFIARHPDELNQTQKSRYCPVALNTRFNDLLEFRNVAVVGLPCHLQGIRNLIRDGVEGTSILSIGLFCERTLSTQVIDRLTTTAVGEETIECFEYKHKGQRGWPGDVYVQSNQGKAVFLDRAERTKLKDAYTPLRCRLCFDKFNVTADISCGDGYGAPHAPDGVSALLVRTPRGRAAIDEAAGALELEEVTIDELLEAHGLEQRQQQSVAFNAAYKKLFPDAPSPLPPKCRTAAGRPSQRLLQQCLRTLETALRLENASDSAEADRIGRQIEARQRIASLPRRLRNILVRITKWGLHIVPGGSRVLKVLRDKSHR